MSQQPGEAQDARRADEGPDLAERQPGRAAVAVTVRTAQVTCSRCHAPTMTFAAIVGRTKRRDVLACPCGEHWADDRERRTITAFCCGPKLPGGVVVDEVWA